MSLLEAARKEFSDPDYGTDRTDKSPSVSFVSSDLSREELKKEAGDAFWEEIKDNPKLVAKWATTISESRLLRAGITPDTYTETIHCKKCGDVPAPPGWMKRVNNCRWCFVGGYQK